MMSELKLTSVLVTFISNMFPVTKEATPTSLFTRVQLFFLPDSSQIPYSGVLFLASFSVLLQLVKCFS